MPHKRPIREERMHKEPKLKDVNLQRAIGLLTRRFVHSTNAPTKFLAKVDVDGNIGVFSGGKKIYEIKISKNVPIEPGRTFSIFGSAIPIHDRATELFFTERHGDRDFYWYTERRVRKGTIEDREKN